MPAALPINLREEIVERRQRKESYRHISEEMGISYATVRSIWQHWKKHGQLAPNYEACRKTGPRKPQAVYEAALALREEHRRWGAGIIRLHLLERFNEEDVPAERTLQSWFRQAGLNRTPANQQPREQVPRGQEVHAVWAVDAKEKMKLADGSGASWLTITDEASGAILDAEAFSPLSLEPGGTSKRSGTSTSAL
jgi:transposase